jgi:hypothetical protein
MNGQPYKDFVRTMWMHLNLKMNFYEYEENYVVIYW